MRFLLLGPLTRKRREDGLADLLAPLGREPAAVELDELEAVESTPFGCAYERAHDLSSLLDEPVSDRQKNPGAACRVDEQGRETLVVCLVEPHDDPRLAPRRRRCGPRGDRVDRELPPPNGAPTL